MTSPPTAQRGAADVSLPPAHHNPVPTQEWHRYLAMVHRRRGLLATCLGVSLVVATVYNYTTRPTYRSTAQIQVGTDEIDALGTRRARRRGATDLNATLQALRSRELAERVVDELKLQESPELRAGALMSPWERFQRRVLGRTPEPVDEAGLPLTPAIAAFRSRITAAAREETNLVDIGFVAYDPQLAASAANALAEMYAAHAAEIEAALSIGATGWLEARLTDQKELVGRAERALQLYQQEHGIVNVEERTRLLEQKLSTMHGALMAARTQRMTRETAYQELLSLPREDLALFPLVRENPVVGSIQADLSRLDRERTRLGSSLGDRHPDMLVLDEQLEAAQNRLVSEVDKVVRAIGNDYRLALDQELTFEASIEPVQRELQELKGATIEYDILKREVQANDQLLRNILSRSQQTGLEGSLPMKDVQIVERAEPAGAPFHPDKFRNYRLAALLGLGLGLLLVFGVEHADQTVKTPEDIREQLGVPFLGLVPDTSRPGKTGPALPSPLILRNPRSALAEAYRVIRTNLIFSSPDARGRTVVVSSVNPGEGKSTTVLNLAASLAQNGARVLIIDADLRRPTIHQHFGVSSVPGLSDLIVGKGARADAVRTTSLKGLDVLPCGHVPPNPAELIGSTAMRTLIGDLRQAYDWVIVDAPPILAMADAPVLSSLVDGLILVVGAERTQRVAILRALDQIASVGGALVGTVLNRVDLRRNAFYFGQYYGEYYTTYYGAGAGLPGGGTAEGVGAKAGRV